MLSPTSPLSIEEKLYAANRMLPRPEFLSGLRHRLIEQPPRPITLGERMRLAFRRPSWVTGLVILLILAVSLIVVGPQRVIAAFIQLFGYIPGVGIVDQGAPLRVLSEPVTLTREGVSITVTSATLTADRTHIEYRIFGVPASAYPEQESVMGCIQPEYLRLPDGTHLSRLDNDFQPVPTGVNQVVLVIPCISNTLPGIVPENWELLLRFMPAPPDLTVMPVIELSPSAQANLTPDGTVIPENENGTPTPIADSFVTVSKEIETSDGYILIGQYQSQSLPGEWTQMTAGPEIHDASGKKVLYTYPQDVIDEVNQEPALTGWAVQFKAAGLVYPLTISFSGVKIGQADPNAKIEFAFDAGPNPQPGQEWVFDQDIHLADHTLKLVSIKTNSQDSYSFDFQVDPKVYNLSVQIEGYTPNGGGGGGGGGLTNGKFNTSLSYSQLPTGVLTVALSDLSLIGDSLSWQVQWSPATPRTDLPTNPTVQPGVCLTSDSLSQLNPAPAELSNGKALLYEQLEGTGKWGLVLYSLDGSQKQVAVSEGNWGSLSPDGSKVAYSAVDNGLHLVDLDSQTEKILPGASGYDIHWSPDGRQIAFKVGGPSGINIASIDDDTIRQISNQSYEALIGFSPDNTRLYFVVPFTGGAAWKVYAADLVSGVTQELFTIENGTPKFLNAKLSPDGKWISYRGRDNSSLYLVHPDGSDLRLVLDNAGVVGADWSLSGWLGLSLRRANSTESTIVLINPDSCEAYQLPAILHGELEGLWLP